jgi:hypothetical protein
MKTKTRNTTLQRNSTIQQAINYAAVTEDGIKGRVPVSRLLLNALFLESDSLKLRKRNIAKRKNTAKNKHRPKIREANESWDRPSERVRVEIASMIWKGRASAQKEENINTGNIRTIERNTEISSMKPKNRQHKHPHKIRPTQAQHSESSITGIVYSACQRTMEWIQSSYYSRVGYNVSATANAPINERINNRTKSHKPKANQRMCISAQLTA